MRILITAVVILLSFVSIAQKETIRQAEKINWYGLDFSEARFIGIKGFPDPEKICEQYVKVKWNSLIFAQAGRYNIGYGFPHKSIEFYPEIVRDINAKISPNGLVTDYDHQIDEATCQRAINRYPSINTTGLSCVFIVESFNKTKMKAFIWVVVFDPFTKQMYYAKRYDGTPGGGGLVNYWLGGIRKIIKKMRTKVIYNR